MNNENIIKWLQVSDIHIGHKDYVETIMREDLPKYVEQLAVRGTFDLLFITGDLIFAPVFAKQTAKIQDISPIQEFVESLQSAAAVDNAHTCIVIGNHDAVRTKDKNAAVDAAIKSYRTGNGSVSGINAILAAESRFAWLYQKLLGEDYPLQGHYIKTISFESADGKGKQQLDVLHLDTVISAEAMQEDEKTRILQDGNLIIGIQLLHDVLSERQASGLPIIAIGHHPFEAFASEEREAIVRELERAGVEIYLCGHTHLAEISRHGKKLLQICCGTNMERLENQNPADMVFFTGTYDLNKGTVSVTAHQYSSLNNGKNYEWRPAITAPFEQTQFEKDTGQTVFYYPQESAPYFAIIEKYSRQIKKVMIDSSQYVSTVPIINPKRPAVSNKEEKWRIYEADTGFGKTMFLRKTASDVLQGYEKRQYSIQEALLKKEIKCPFYINLESKLYCNKGDSITNLLAKSIRLSPKSSIQFNIFSQWIAKLADSGRLLLLIDGLEKVEEKLKDDFLDTLLKFLSEYPEAEVWITAKYFVFDSGNMQKKFEGFAFYQLEAFKDEQIRQYCEVWYKNELGNTDEDSSLQSRAQKIAEQILADPSLNELARVPLLLNTLLQVNKSLNTLPKNRIRLYDSFIYALLKEKPYPESDIELLAAIAFKMQRELTNHLSANRVKRIIQTIENKCDWLHYSANRKIGACKFLEEMNRNSRLLKKQEGRDSYTFYNDVIQDYFASLALVKGYYEELQPWMKREKSPESKDISQHPLVEQLKELWDHVENRSMLLLTILQLNVYETSIVMEELLRHIDNEEAMNKVSVEVNSHLRNLLLRVILDGAYITREQRKRVFQAVQKNNLFDLQADLLEEVFNSRFSEEFEGTCSHYISELFRLLREEENPVQYLCDKIWSGTALLTESQELEEALYVLDGVIWSRGREYLEVYQKTNTISELVHILEFILKDNSVDTLCKRRVCGVLHRLLKSEVIDSLSAEIIQQIFCVYEDALPAARGNQLEGDYIYAGIRIFDAIPLDEGTISQIRLFHVTEERKNFYKQLYLNADNPQDKMAAFEAAVLCQCWDLDEVEKILVGDSAFQSKIIDLGNLNTRIKQLIDGHFFEELRK